MLNRDFTDMLSALSANEVEFLLVGAHALGFHGLPRATGDLDLWVRPSKDNAQRVWKALAEFGAPLGDVTEEDFSKPGVVFQIGVEPSRIDILTHIDGVEFDEAWEGREKTILNSIPVCVLGRKHFIRNKKAVGRPKDVADVSQLESS